MNDLISRKDVYDMLNALGGCGAQEEYFKGWDAAIDGAIDALEKIPFVNLLNALGYELQIVKK